MISRINKHDSFVAVIHSLAFFMLAYLFVWLFQSLTTVLVANSLEIPTAWYYDRIDFLIPEAKWDADLVKLTFSTAPLISLVISILFLIAYYKVMELNGILKLFFLWGYIHGWTGFFGSVFIGTITGSGFGYVVAWLYLNDTALLTTSLVSLFMLFLGGFIIARPVLISANYYVNFLPEESRNGFLFSQMILPAFIGICLIVVLRVPASYEVQLIPFTAILMILPVFMRRYHFPVIYFDDEKIETRLEWIYIILSISFATVFRIIFASGLRSGD